jgi:spore coat protein CotF
MQYSQYLDMHFSFVVYHMKSTGWVHISDEDSKDLHYAYQADKEADKAKPSTSS